MEKVLDALKIAREAMKERRAYCEQWEYKYGKEWDNEDGYIQDAIEKLQAKINTNKYHPMGTEKVNEICLTCGLHCPDNCPLDK
jgi:hypothetical protein